MKLLLLASSEDGKHLDRFSKLPSLRGIQVAVSRSTRAASIADVALLARSVVADGLICTDQTILKLILESQYDYIPPNTRRGVTLDDYAGSVLTLHAIPGVTKELEVLVLNPPEQLLTVPYAGFVFERFISKLTQPQNWLPALPFQWRVYDNAVDTVESVCDLFNNMDLVAVDIETEVGDPDRRINCVGYCGIRRRDNYVVCIVVPTLSWENLMVVRRLNALPVAKIFQNGLYDNTYFARWGVPVSNWIWDTQHLFHAWLSELPKRLDFIAAFSVRKIRYWKDDGSTGSLSDYYRYNALDCWATLSAFLGLMQDIPDWAVRNYAIEFPLVFPCLHCGLEGIKIDVDRMAVAKAEADKRLEGDLTRLRFLIDSPGFNPNSSVQTLQLFKVLGLILPSTDKANMLKAKASSPFNELILTLVTNYRENGKLLSIQLNPEKLWNGRIYYNLNPAGTVSGRLASQESAFWCGIQIQNITRGKEVKQCYVSDEGWVLAEIDKAQSEARCVGYLSGEEKLIRVLEGPKDFHRVNAEQFFGIPYDQIDTVIRDLSKRTNHGANYNMSDGVMLETMGPKNVLRAKKALRLPVSMRLKAVCGFLLERYARTYPKVKGLWYQSVVKRIALSGKLVSALGWTRKFFGSPDKNKRDLNAAVAHEPQNLSVGIVNKEFFRIWQSSLYGELKGRIRLKAQIHDSILFQYRPEDSELPIIVRDKYMNTHVIVTGADDVKRDMFIPSDIAAGKNRWSELK